MKTFFKIIILYLIISTLVISCAKKTLTLDEKTSMKTLLKASDEEITELIIKEASEKANITAEDISVEYILRDKETQTIIVKSKIKED